MRTLLLLLLSMFSSACSPGKDPSPPSAGTYAIVFPSTAAAVSADSVKVFVFDAADSGVDRLCPNLVIARRSNQALPSPLAESRTTPPCDLVLGKGQITVSYGVRAILAVAQKEGADYLIGCAVQNVAEGSAQVPVQLALASSTVSVPPTTCATLTDHCSNRCP